MQIEQSVLRKFEGLWNSQFREKDHPRDDDGKFTSGGGGSSGLDLNKRKLSSVRDSISEKKELVRNLSLGTKPDARDVRDFFDESGIETGDIYTAQTGSQYFTAHIGSEEFKVRISDHENQTTDLAKSEADLNLVEGSEKWADDLFGFMDDNGIEPKGNWAKKRKRSENLEKEIEILRDESLALERSISKLLPSHSDERAEAIMDYVAKSEALRMEWEDIQKIGGSTGKTARRLFRRRVESMMEKQNASDFPKYYFTRHMQAGLCGYEDETILIDTDAVAKLGKTFKGKPIYIQHQDVNLDTLKQDAVGYVQDTWMGVDGWLWSEIMITDDEAHEVIAKGWAVSNAYVPTVFGDGGTKHNIPFDREVMDGEFTHLAIVPNPRYEGAKIYTPDEYQARNVQLVNSLANSKPTKKKGFVMKFWKKEEVSNASDADFVEYTNDAGETVTKSVEEMKNALEADKKQKEALAKTVLVNGKEMTVAELTAAYEKLNAKKNKCNESKEEDEAHENEDDSEEKDNGEVEEEKDNESDEDEKKNSKADHFNELRNAPNKKAAPIIIETTMNKTNRGSALYGSGR